MANWLLVMSPVILSEPGGARDGWVVMMRGAVREQTVLLEQLFSPGYEMEFWRSKLV